MEAEIAAFKTVKARESQFKTFYDKQPMAWRVPEVEN